MTKYYYILLSLFICLTANTQEIKLSIITGSNLFQNIKDTNSFYSPQNSYYTFQELDEGEGLIKHKNNINFSINLGLKTSLFYKKWSVNIEPQYFYKRSSYFFYNTSWTTVGKGFRLPTYITYKAFKKNNSIYFLGGVSITKVKNYDFQNNNASYNFGTDLLYNGQVNFGVNLFSDYIYANNAYTNVIVGFGKPFKKFDLSIRFMKQLQSKKHPIVVSISQIEFELAWHLLSSKDITNKHFLYVE